MPWVTVWLICLGALAALPIAAAAPGPGARVRLFSPPALIKPTPGTLVHLSRDSLTFRPDGAPGESLRLPLSAVTGFELSRGKLRNTGNGALIGLFAGPVLGLAAWATEDRGSFFKGPGLIPFGALGGLFEGAVIGMLIRTEKWESVDRSTFLPPVGALGVPKDRLALCVRLARF